MTDPRYYCGGPDDGAPVGSRRDAAARQLARIKECAHPYQWREPIRGLAGDGSCNLCGASQLTVQRHLRERREAREAAAPLAGGIGDARRAGKSADRQFVSERSALNPARRRR